MKYLLGILILVVALLSGCTSSTSFGQCVGIVDEKDPGLVYKVDTTNAVVGIVFIETIVVPIVVLSDQTFCPVGKK